MRPRVAQDLCASLELGGEPLELFGDEGIAGLGGGTAAMLSLTEQILLGGHGRASDAFLFFILSVRLPQRGAAWPVPKRQLKRKSVFQTKHLRSIGGPV
jgi:hypothetical protein